MYSKHIQLIENYLCPGCVAGSDTTCGQFDFKFNTCNSHVCGTSNFVSSFALGLPKGFNRFSEDGRILVYESIQEQDDDFSFDIFNLPVWVTQYENDVIARVVSPRTAKINTIVIADTNVNDIIIHNSARDTSVSLDNFDFKPLILNNDIISMMD